MIGSLRKGFFSLVLALALVIHCMAAEGDNQIKISFSIWSPLSMDRSLVDNVVIDALRSFLCQDTALILLDTNFRSVCYRRDTGEKNVVFPNIAKLSIIGYLKQTDPTHSYIIDKPLNMLVSNLYEAGGTLQATVWDVSYLVLQVGVGETDNARTARSADEMNLLERKIQRRLNLSIIEGVMDQRLRGTDVIMAKLGQEYGTEFGTLPKLGQDPGSPNTFEEENIEAAPILDYSESARVLRYIGIALLITTIFVNIMLTYCARQYRLKKEREEKERSDPKFKRGLVTEEGVNIILERGRRESERLATIESERLATSDVIP